MKKENYSDEIVLVPTGVEYHDQMDDLRTSLAFTEDQRDSAVALLREIIEVDDAEDTQDVISRIKELLESPAFTDVY